MSESPLSKKKKKTVSPNLTVDLELLDRTVVGHTINFIGSGEARRFRVKGGYGEHVKCEPVGV